MGGAQVRHLLHTITPQKQKRSLFGHYTDRPFEIHGLKLSPIRQLIIILAVPLSLPLPLPWPWSWPWPCPCPCPRWYPVSRRWNTRTGALHHHGAHAACRHPMCHPRLQRKAVVSHNRSRQDSISQAPMGTISSILFPLENSFRHKEWCWYGMSVCPASSPPPATGNSKSRAMPLWARPTF